MNPDAALTITTDTSRIDIDAALALLRDTYWAVEMTRDTLAKALANSLCFGILRDDALVGLARVVTDRATFAYLTDIVVAAPERGRGLGHRLLEAILAHPDLQGLRRYALLTSDAMKLYEDFGFTVGSEPLTYMERR
jgi:N-acetylglutamate synthase-like GNAT family acetyltransferase